jgi:hypothetical protein
MQCVQADELAEGRAITIAEHRDWPDRPDWEEGPDALRYPGLYDADETDQVADESGLGLLEIEEHDPAR